MKPTAARSTSRRRRETRISAAVETWFRTNARDLPWRTSPRDPYASLVAEAMLQQTQVSRVLEHFTRFLNAFPTIRHLAAADEQRVLAHWSGLGYYRRARSLHSAARLVVDELSCRIPADVPGLLRLPGVGRYTAGALASIVHNQAEPIVDGNVARVLMRVDGIDLPPQDTAVQKHLWARAHTLVQSAASPAGFNEGLMELGATICLPRAPRCDACPLRRDCLAHRDSRTEDIPRPKGVPARQVIHAAAVLVSDQRGRLLVLQRPSAGMWAGMWEAPTFESPKRISPGSLERWAGAGRLRRVDSFVHQTTHREFRFAVFLAAKRRGATSQEGGTIPVSLPDRARRWMSVRALPGLPISNPQRRVLRLALSADTQ